MDMLESNYRTWCSQNNIQVDDDDSAKSQDIVMETIVEEENDNYEEDEWGGIMEDDEHEVPAFFKDELDLQVKQENERQSKRRKKGKVAELIRNKVQRVLGERTGLAEKRARACDEGDFLKLLWAFNNEGIHFN